MRAFSRPKHGLPAPLADGEGKAIQARTTSNSLESGGIKTRVVQPLPHAQKLNRILVAEPRFNERAATIELRDQCP